MEFLKNSTSRDIHFYNLYLEFLLFFLNSFDNTSKKVKIIKKRNILVISIAAEKSIEKFEN